MSRDPEAVACARQQRARELGLCGVRFGYYAVCDEPAGHEPIAPPHWLHSEDVVGSPLGDRLEELHGGQ